MDLKALIRDVADFPKPGVLFRDITPLLKNPAAFHFIVDEFVRRLKSEQLAAVVGIESRGFIFGSALAYALKLPFVPVRKPGKLPAARMSVEYTLEYGSSQLDIHQDALKQGGRVVIVDDLLATAGTAHAAAKLVELLGAKVAKFLFVIELSELKGRDKLIDYALESLVVY